MSDLVKRARSGPINPALVDEMADRIEELERDNVEFRAHFYGALTTEQVLRGWEERIEELERWLRLALHEIDSQWAERGSSQPACLSSATVAAIRELMEGSE